MGCSGRVKKDDLRADQKWDFISLNDFKSTSWFQPLAYGYLWLSLIISTAVYGVDTFTAVNLLAFNKWSGEIEPIIPFDVSKWIFSICIILSWVNVGFEHLRAMRNIKRGAVAESFLDSLAVRLQSVRLGKGRGWKRFLVFAELTKSRKGTEYVALFTYFAFQSWIRVIFCQGPRQVINALTLISVFKTKFTGLDTTDVGTSLTSFFEKIAFIAEENNQQAVILSGMVFTLVIWVFSALSLLLAVLFFITFLWHYIPKEDGGLSGFCEKKVNRRLARIVSAKVNKAIEDQERKRIKAEAKAVKKGEKSAAQQATLPTFDQQAEDKLPAMPMMDLSDTISSLPMYSSRPGTPSSQHGIPAFELESLEKRPFGSRTATDASTATTASYASNAPLMGNASDMGYGRSGSPAPSLPPLNTNGYPAMPPRSMTANLNASFNQGPPRMPSAMGDRGYTASPSSYDHQSPTSVYNQPMDPYARPMPRALDELNGRSFTPGGPAPSMGRRTPFDQGGRSSPAPSAYGEDYGRSSPAPTSYAPAPAGYGPADYRRPSPAPMGDPYGRIPVANRPTNMSQPSIDNFGRNMPAPIDNFGRNSPAPGNYQPYDASNMSQPSIDNFGRNMPAPIDNFGRNSPAPGNYQPYDASIRSASAAPRQNPAQAPQYRNMTDPGYGGQDGGDYYSNNAPPLQRPGTANSQRPGTANSQRPGTANSQMSRPGFGGNGYRQ